MASNEDSPETRAFQKHYATLVNAIQDPDTLADELFAKRMLSREVLMDLQTPGLSNAKKNRKILHCVYNHLVFVDPSKLRVFIEVLRCEPYAVDLSKMLEASYWKCQEEQIPPTRNVEKEGTGVLLRLDGDQSDTQGSTYQSYCSNVQDVYRRAPSEGRSCWPPMGRVKYVNLAILKSEKLTVSDDYTLKTIQRSVDDIVAKKERIDYMELFDGLESGSKILVEGRPGCGKTTLLNRISLDWAAKTILNDIELLLLVPLRRFHSKAEVEFEDMLQLYDTGNLCHSVGTQISLSGGKGVCIVLDGLDEYPQCSKPGNFVLELLEGRKLPNSVVIAASRPAAAHHLRQYATKRVEVLGFLRPEIQQYVQEHYKEANDKLKSLSTYLEHHPNIRHMCYLPLHLAMVVYLNDVLESGSLPHTETGTYDKFMLHTLLRDMRRNSQSNVEQLRDVKQLHPEKLEVFRNICSLAFSATVQSEQIFSRNDIQEVFGCNEFSLESLGLLTEDKLFCEYGLEETYSFSHLTFQEFLAAYHLTRLPAADQMQAAEQHAGDKHMGVVWKFYCGLTKLSGKVAMDVFRVLLQQDQSNLLLLLLSIHESQNQKACCELLTSRNGELRIIDEVLTPADMLAVAYCMRNASTSLTKLAFAWCYSGSEELQVLTSECSSPFMDMKHLSLAALKHTKVEGSVWSTIFTALKECRELRQLNLVHLNIDDAGCATLSPALKECGKLQTLRPSLEDILPSVNHIAAFHNKFGNAVCAALSRGLQECRELQELYLWNNSLTDASVENILRLITTAKSLKTLHIWGNDFTVGGKAQLRQAAKQRKSYPDFVEFHISV